MGRPDSFPSRLGRRTTDTAGTLAWDDFRLTNAVAATCSLSAAAARLGIEQSTIFRRLTQIEVVLGTALFERQRAGYVLTAVGEEMATFRAPG